MSHPSQLRASFLQHDYPIEDISSLRRESTAMRSGRSGSVSVPPFGSESNDNSSSRLIQQKEQIIVDMDMIKQAALYENPSIPLVGGEVETSAMFALNIINSIIDTGAEMIYNNYLDSKMHAHVLGRTFYLAQLAQDQWDLNYDTVGEDAADIPEDPEPACPKNEAWRGYNIGVERKPPANDIPQTTNGLLDSPSTTFMRQSRRKQTDVLSQASSVKSTMRKKQQNLTLKMEDSPMQVQQSSPLVTPQLAHASFFGEFQSNVVNVSTKDEIDRVEEQLRLLKDRELELKVQKAEMDAKREAEREEQKQRMRLVGNTKTSSSSGEGAASGSGQRFAYDFNGSVLGLTAVRTDRFPDAAIVLLHTVSMGVIDENKNNLNAPKLNKQSLKKVNSSSNNSSRNSGVVGLAKKNSMSSIFTPKNVVGGVAGGGMKNETSKAVYFPPSVEVFDRFAVNKGVTLIEGGRTKKGAEFFSVLQSVDLDAFADGKAVAQLKRQDYNDLVSGKKPREKDMEFDEDDLLQYGDATKTDVKKSKKKEYKPMPFRSAKIGQRKVNMGQLLDPIDGVEYGGKIHVKSQEMLLQLQKDFQDDDGGDDQILLSSDLSLLEVSGVAAAAAAAENEKKKDTLKAGLTPAASVKQRKKKLMPLLGKSASNSNMVIDEFNRQIVKSGNMWGSMLDGEQYGNSSEPLSIGRVAANYKERHVFGSIEKFPRERLFKKSQQLMTHLHLGSPSVGNTMGHGYLGDGFNPNRLVNSAKYLEGVRAQSSSVQENESSYTSNVAQMFVV